jgi:hypothetical protein
MSKREIIKEIMDELDVGHEQAENIFCEARKNGDITIHLNWNKIVSATIFAAVISSALWALYQWA